MRRVIEELRRRNVFRVGIAFLAFAWFIVQVIETLFPILGFSDTAIRIIVVVLAICFPLVLIFSWLYELTPEGLKLERDVDRAQSVVHHTGKKLDRLIIVVLLLAVGYFALDKFVIDPIRDETRVAEARREARSEALVKTFAAKAIAVLPFMDMSAAKDQEYLALGLAEELMNVLTRVSALRVISRSSAFSFRSRDVERSTIAQELGVTYLLEGSVRTDGNRVRVTVQLVDAPSDTNIWSQIYEREFDSILAVQDEIAGAVADQLSSAVPGAAPNALKKTDPAAYALYLRARHQSQRSSADSLEAAKDLYLQALDIDPNYAPAWEGLAGTYINLTNTGTLQHKEGYGLAEEAAQRALKLDAQFARAHSRLAWVYRWRDSDLQRSASVYEIALTLDPENVHILGEAAQLLGDLGRLHDLISVMGFIASRDPVNPRVHYNSGVYNYFAGNLSDARKSFSKTLVLSPQFIGAHHHLGLVDLADGDPAAALQNFDQEMDEEWQVKGRALAYHALGRLADAELALQELIDGWGEQWPSEIAHVYAFRGQIDETFELLKTVDNNAGGWGEGRHNPLLRKLHDDPRWQQFLARIGKSDADLAAIQFDITLPE